MSKNDNLNRLIDIVAQLRSENGCPWDRRQTHESLRTCLLEETYEVLDAIDRRNNDDLREELGDLLLQVVFHAQLAEEDGLFDLTDVENTVCDKMIRRHPHVFGSAEVTSAREVLRNWEQIKKEEHADEQERFISIMNNVPATLPALLQADKVQLKAARVGFDWDDMSGPRAKINEELRELDEAIAGGRQEKIDEELGDLLFSIVNLARFVHSDAEQSLRTSCRKFISRFQFMEKRLAEQQRKFSELDLDQMDEIWEQAKEREK